MKTALVVPLRPLLLACILVNVAVDSHPEDTFLIGHGRYNRTEAKINAAGFEENQRANVVLLPGGGFVVAWHEGTPPDCYGRVFDNAGSPASGPFSLHPYGASGWQYGPSVGALQDGAFVAAWGGASSYVHAQKFEAASTPSGGEINVTAMNAWPALAAGPLGDFLVAFGTTDSPVLARRYNPQGEPSEVFEVGPYVAGWFHPSVAYGADGRSAIAWPSSGNIWCRAYAAGGVQPLGSPFQANTDATWSNYHPSLQINSQGDLLLAWSGSSASEDAGVFLRRFDSNGQGYGPEASVTEELTGGQSQPNLGIGPNDELLVAWQQSGDIFAKCLSANGTATSESFPVNAHTTGSQLLSGHSGLHGTAILDNQNLVIAWAGDGDSGGGVYLTFLEHLGNVGITITRQPESTKVGEGATALLSVAATSLEPLQYRWQRGEEDLTDSGAYGGTGTQSLMISTATPAEAGDYRVVIANDWLSVTSQVAVLEVGSTTLACPSLRNSTLVLAESPYRLTCDLELEQVSIEAGVRIEATGDFGITVIGGLHAVGSGGQPILFTTMNDTTKWQGIHFSGSTEESELLYCIVENSRNSGLRIDDATPIIRHCDIRRNQAVNGAGIRISGSEPVTLEDCQVYENTYSGSNPRGGGIHSSAPLILIGCAVTANAITDSRGCWGSSASTYGGGIYSTADVILENVELTGNTASSRGGAENSRGGGIYTSGQLVARNCVIANNYAGAGGCNIGDGARGYGGGIFCGSAVELVNCIIANNATRDDPSQSRGGGVYAANGSVVNCTVVQNTPGGVYFGGAIVNSVFWGNSSYQFSGGATAEWSCIQGIAPTNGNISDDPLLPLYDPSAPENLRIPCDTSPCVDAGNPAPEYNDVASPECTICGTSRNDMGAHGGPGGCGPAEAQWVLELTASPVAGGSLTGAGRYTDGSEVPVSAEPAPGYRFDHWDGDGITEPVSAETTVLMDQNRSLTAQYVKTWLLTLEPDPQSAGTVTGAGTYDDGNEAEISAEPSMTSWFLGWTGEGTADPNAPVTTVLMDQDRSVVGYFAAPDLQVNSITLPQAAIANGLLRAEWEIANGGIASAIGAWTDRLWFSTDDQIGEDIPAELKPVETSIFPGGSVKRIQHVRVPAGLEGAYWLVLEVNSDRGLGESDYANNLAISAAPVTVTPAPYPDLQIGSLTAPANVFAGQPSEVEWTVLNAGPQSTGATQWEDAVYLSEDDRWDTGDRLLGSAANQTALTPDQGYNSALSFTVPKRIHGTYYLIVRADFRRAVPEGGLDDNNAGGSEAMEVELPGWPDLEVASVITPFEAFSGQLTTIQWSVTNTGSLKTDETSWEDRIFLSETADGVGIVADLGATRHEGSLEPGGSYTTSREVRLPVGVYGPEFYFMVRADSANSAWEYVFESNNSGASTHATEIHLTPPPDLEVVEITGPAEVCAGLDLALTYRVANPGANATPNYSWYDTFYLSEDEVFDGSDRLLGRTAHRGQLQRDEEYTASATFKAPQDLSGDYYLIARSDVEETVFELDRTNNQGTSATQVTIKPLADLAVGNVTVPAEGQAGFAISVSYAVSNTAECPTLGSAWNDRFYLSTDESLDVSEDVLLGQSAHAGQLGAGGGYDNTVSLTLPIGLVGQYHLLVAADGHGQVPERNESNNAGSSPLPIALQLPANDLLITTVIAPTSVLSGFDLTVSCVVTNQGADSIPNSSWFDGFYLSEDDVLSTNDIYLDEVLFQGTLGGGGAYTNTATVRLPDGLAGTFHLFVLTDSRAEVFEGDEANNLAEADELITVESVPPDLVVESCQIPPGTYIAGASVPVSWLIRNAGPGLTSVEAWSDGVVLSGDDTFGNQDGIPLAGLAHSGALDADQTYSAEGTVTLPAGTPAGAYYLFVQVDSAGDVYEGEADSNNQCLSGPITVIRPDVDLVVNEVGTPLEADSGHLLTLSWTVQNLGNSPAGSATWRDYVYLSRGAMIGEGAVLLGRIARTGGLAAGGTYSVTHDFELPWELEGDYYVLLEADGDGRLIESTEENNVGGATLPVYVHLSRTPDLLVSGFEVPAQALSGQPIEVTWRVLNNGAPTAERWYDTVFLSLDQVFDRNTDTALGYSEHTGGLDEGAGYTVTRTFDLPREADGSMYLFVFADSRNRVYERGAEANNTARSSQVHVDQPSICDLVATEIELPDAELLLAGETNSFTYTVLNQSTAAASGRWQDSLYLSADIEWDLDDVLLGTVVAQRDVPAWGSYTDTLTVPVPGVIPGAYHIIVRTDLRNQIPESEEANNLAFSGQTLPIDVTELALGVPYTNQLSTGTEHFYKVNTPEGETLSITLDSASDEGFNELFTSFERIPSRAQSEHRYSEPFSPDQQITVSDTQTGRYFNLVRGEEVSNPLASYTIKAETIPFGIRSVSPTRIGDEGQVTITLYGARFKEGARVLLQARSASATASSVTVVDGATIKARFLLSKHIHGLYDVIVTNPDGEMAIAESAVTVETATDLTPEIIGSADRFPRVGSHFRWAGFVRNAGNVDIPQLVVAVLVDESLSTSLQAPSVSLPPPLPELPSPHAFAVFDVEPGNGYPFSFSVAGFTIPFLYDIVPIGIDPNSSNVAVSGEAESGRMVDSVLGSNRNDFEKCRRRCLRTATIETAAATTLLGLCLGGSSGAAAWFCWYAWDVWMVKIAADVAFCLGDCSEDYPPGCGGEKTRGGVISGQACPRTPIDPNEKAGPTGYAVERFVSPSEPLSYRVYFENIPEATATAREIRILDRLGGGFDPRSAQLHEVVFGTNVVLLGPDRTFFEDRRRLSTESEDLLANSVGFVDVGAREIQWTLRAIDQNTGELPEDARAGVLPPNDDSHRGEGYVSYTVLPERGLPTGTVITNWATIVFDNNDPIETNPVWNTIDAGAPTSMVEPPAQFVSSEFPVFWSGEDDAGGSGVQGFDVYVSDNESPYELWLSNTPETMATFTGEPGHTYAFYSRGRDNVGNVEEAPEAADAITTVASNTTPLLEPVEDQFGVVNDVLLVTNLVDDAEVASQEFEFTLLQGPAGASLRPISATESVLRWTPSCAQGSSTNLVRVKVTDNGIPPLSATNSYLVTVYECVELSLGRTNVLAGQQACIPLDLLSTVELTNLTFSVLYPPERFSDFVLEVNPEVVSAPVLEEPVPGELRISFDLPADKVLRGPTNVATLCFIASEDQASAFVPIEIANVDGQRPTGGRVANAYGLPGRVAVVGEEPLLEAWGSRGSSPVMEIYGQPGSTYNLECTESLSAPVIWRDCDSITLLNMVQEMGFPDGQGRTLFIRARKD